MATVRILTQTQLQDLVRLDDEAVACVRSAFKTLAGGSVVMPPILRLDIADANGEVDVKTAYVPGLSRFAIKISPGFFNNPAIGLPSTNGMMAVLSTRTGLLEALLLDNGYLTDVRTAAAGAVAADHLARKDARTVAIIGAGMQARMQLEALALVRGIDEVRVWARDDQKAQAFAQRVAADRGLEAKAFPIVRDAMRGADIVITTTPAATPLIEAGWLEPGQHITAMGSDAEHKNEIAPQALLRADLYVADSLSQTRRLGELHHAIAAGLIVPDAPLAELGAIIAGAHRGREDAAEITIADLTGTGVQDTAIADLACARALAADIGTEIST